MLNDQLVSVIVPFRDESDNLSDCLSSLVQQVVERASFEVILADGGSGNKEKIAIKENSMLLNLKVISNSKNIFSSGANLAIKKAIGNYIVILGAHTKLSPNYIKRGLEILAETGADCVGGRLYPFSKGTYIAKAISLVISSPFGVGNSKFRYSDKAGFVDTVAYGIYRREVFNKIGMFDEVLVRNQDIEFNARLTGAGFKIYFSPEIYAEYRARDNLSDFIKQNFSNGYWNIITILRNPSALSWRHFVPLAFVLSLFISMFCGIFWLLPKFVAGLILGAYFIASLGFSAVISIQRKISYKILFLLPFIFAVFHIAYGTGSVWALLLSPFMWIARMHNAGKVVVL